ncbi:diacylglycerol kinase [Bifidobacterium felsineum]|uniref:Diacylglycerol kinase n=2 Tax=Bifidobacterium felsineum TaxID=2045440 RepID=A0A2M9HM86_9BIFI|nr:diacylglycerol kinase [Bifidobacterium felsineum]
MFTNGMAIAGTALLPLQIGIMPQSTLTVLIIIAAVLLIAAITLGIRTARRRRLAATLEKRRDDEVQYAFIINPSKPQAATQRLHIQEFCRAKGLNRIRFYDTQLDKDGRACALEALEDGADVVIAVGGDGTVRTVASAVSGTGHALGIIPIGTGNLFARNMGIPVDDIDAALTVATSHGSRLVDMGRLRLLDHPEDDHGHAFLIIAGIGFDAAMIDDTDPALKANISWLAYFVGGIKNLFAPKFRGNLTITSADGSTHSIKNLDFRTIMAGNCGQIPVFSLMPAASYDDGILDFEIIDTTGGILGWANLFGDVVHQTITGKPEQNPLSTNSTVEQVQGITAEITLEKPAKAQVDGDMLPETKHIRFSVDQRALIVRVPDTSTLKTAQVAAANATSDFAETTSILEPVK